MGGGDFPRGTVNSDLDGLETALAEAVRLLRVMEDAPNRAPSGHYYGLICDFIKRYALPTDARSEERRP